MWIREVEFPEPLVEAAQAGELVLFVGAGASRDSPSDLPDFGTLTRDIAAEAGVTLTVAELSQPDLALGRIEGHGVDVHHRVAVHIGATGSSPNLLHQAVAELALATRYPRIVTTNYDKHLTAALSAMADERIGEYQAPALPMGDDFSGLVHLHGSLDQDSRHLVVTDSDFGRAYLRDAWAARFLERMFTTYTVLFIGYSHADVVMRYLARSLTPQSRRFAMTGDPDTSQWRPLNIEIVHYPVDAGSHQALGTAVAGLAQLLSMRLLDHRQRLARLVDGSPPTTPEDISYLEATLLDGERTRVFCELARGEEWLRWTATQPAFKELFGPRSSTSSDSAIALCYWFTEQFVASEDLRKTALDTVRDTGGQWSFVLWNAVGQQLHRSPRPRPRWLDPWLVLLLEHAPSDGRDWLEYALVASRLPEDVDAVLLLFDYLTEPVAGLESSYGFGDQPRFSVTVRGDKHWLGEAWNNLIQPNLGDIVDPLLIIAERHLRRAHQLLRLAGSAQPGWDPVSFGRSSISVHAQDRHRDGLDFLIDAARECVTSLLESGHHPPIESWATSDVPILRRLALFSWTHRPDVTDDERLGWLLDRGWLYDHQLRHEVFELIASALPGASPNIRGAVLEQANLGPSDVAEADERQYERFNAVAWLDRHSDDPTIRAAFEAIADAHPNFKTRQYPDLLSWSESDAVGYQPPMSADELHERLRTDVAEAIRELRAFESALSPWDGPTWEDTTGLIAETVARDPADGFRIIDVEKRLTTDISRAVLRGWSRANLSDEDASSVLQLFQRFAWHEIADDVAWLLGESGRDEGAPDWHRLDASHSLASELWDAIGPAQGEGEPTDWLTRAINTPAGRIAQFWIRVIQAEWRSAGDRWEGIPGEVRAELDRLIEGDDARHHMAQVLFASQLLFLFSADREWCLAKVLPLLSWDDPATARRAWDGFLISGRWNDGLLEAGLLDEYLASAQHRRDLREAAVDQLADHLASVAVYSELDSLDWARTLTAEVDRDFGTEWLQRVSWILGRLTEEAVEEQWKGWLKEYWLGRLDSVPRALTNPEASAMCGWVAHLTNSIDEAVELALQHECGIERHGNLLHGLKDRVDSDPNNVGQLVAHVLSGTAPQNFWGCHNLREIVEKVDGRADPDIVLRIREESIRLGCTGAADW